MSTPNAQESKSRAAAKEAEELQDRIINLQDQERQVQREAAERRDHEAMQLVQREREQAGDQRREQVQAYAVLERQARDGARDAQVASRRMSRATAATLAPLMPPVLTQPRLLVDVVFTTTIAVLSFQRDVLIDLLSVGQPVDAR